MSEPSQADTGGETASPPLRPRPLRPTANRGKEMTASAPGSAPEASGEHGTPAAGPPQPHGSVPRRPVRFAQGVKQADAPPERVSTGLRSMDAALGGGLEPGRLYLVADGPDGGASLLAAGAARVTAFEQQRTVLYRVSGPSPADLAARITAAHLNLDYQALRAGALTAQGLAAAADLGGHPGAALLHIVDGCGLDAAALADLAQDLPGLALVVVDRLRMARKPGAAMSGLEAVAAAVRELTQLARSHRVAVLAVVDTADPAAGADADDAFAPDEGELLASLGADVTMVMRGNYLLGPFADIVERDLGTVGSEVRFRIDPTHARLRDLPPPPYHHAWAFAGRPAGEITAELVAASRPCLERRDELPKDVAHVLLRLVDRVDAGPDEVSVDQDAIVTVAAGRPALPDTEDGRRLQAAMDALLGHAVARGFRAPAQERNLSAR